MGLSFNMSLLKSTKSEFDSEHKHFDNTSYSTYKSSYIRSCPDSYVQQMRNKLNPLYEKIDKGYNNITSWWADYNNDIERLDNALASNGGTNLIRESAVSVFINSRFWYLFAQPSYLSYYYTPFIDVITLKYFKTEYEQKQWHEEQQVQIGNQTFDLTKIEDKDAYIDALKAERSMLEDLYATFTAGAHVNYSGLEADHVHWYNPEECRNTVSEQHEWMAEHGYSTDDWRMDQSYLAGREAYYKYIDEVYTPLYNQYFAEYSKEYFKDYPEAYNCYKGITYDQVLARKAEIESQLAQLGVEETIWADLAVFGTSFVEGVAKFGESLVDCGAIVVTGFETAGVFGESLGSWIVTGENTISEDVGALWDSTMGFVKTDYVGDVADKFYDYTGLDQSSRYFDSTRALGSGIGKVAGITTLTVATGGSNVLFAGLSGFGEGTERAWQEGATLGEGLFSGAVQGSWDSLQWYVGGKINAWNPVSPDVTGAKFFNALIRVGADGVDSAAEGIVQPLISTIYKDSYYDENGNEIKFTDDDNFFERYGKMFNDAGGWTNVLINGLIGSGSSVLGEISGVSKYFSNKQKLSYLPEKVDISINGTSRTMDVKELFEIVTDENKLNRFFEFDKNIDLFPSGSKDEYLIGIKELIDTANNGKVDLGLSQAQLNKIDKMVLNIDPSMKVYPLPDNLKGINKYDSFIDFVTAYVNGETNIDYADAKAYFDMHDVNLSKGSLTKILDALELPANIGVPIDLDATRRLMNVGSLLSIVTDQDKFNKFLEFDKYSSMFPDGTKEEYALGIKQLLEAADKNKIDLGLTEIQAQQVKAFIADIEKTLNVDRMLSSAELYVSKINEFAANGISYQSYLKSIGIDTINLKTPLELAEYMGDSKLYMLTKLYELKSLATQTGDQVRLSYLINKYSQMSVGDVSAVDMLNDIGQYLSFDEQKQCLDLMNNGKIDVMSYKYSSEQLAAIYNYTACGGKEINAWLNNTDLPWPGNSGVPARQYFASIDEIQDKMSSFVCNRVFSSSQASIIDTLDSIIKNAKYDDAIVTYRGIKDLWDYDKQISVDDLRIGDRFGSAGYQSSSILLENCYGKKNDTNIILEIIVLPNSGTAAYIENVSGVTKYGQTEMLIKRDAIMTVVGDVYKKIVNGVEKTFVPVVVQ